jgi:hypothetical protein
MNKIIKSIADKAIEEVGDEFLDTDNEDEIIWEIELEVNDHMVAIFRSNSSLKKHKLAVEVEYPAWSGKVYTHIYQYINEKWIRNK